MSKMKFLHSQSLLYRGKRTKNCLWNVYPLCLGARGQEVSLLPLIH